MIGTGAAILGSALIGGGISAYSTNKAANKAAGASQAATDANTRLQEETLAQQQANTATQRATGDAALNALATRFGLDNGTNQATGGGTVAASQTGPNWDAYLQQNPDVQADYQRYASSPEYVNGGGDGYGAGLTPEQFAQHHYQIHGQAEGRQLPTYATQPTAPPDTPTQTAPVASATSNVDANGAYTVDRPEIAPAPTYRETSVAPLDVGLDKYEQSPDYNFQLDQGNKNILANASATGGLESGAALKALQTFGQNLALGDYSQWRDYTTGQYNNDRAFTANRDDAYNSYANNQYQYGTTLSQNVYNSDRDYASNRYDARTNALMGLAGYGQNATNSSNNALAANATNIGNGYFSNANNQGNAALAGAGQINNLLSNGASALAYYYGRQPSTANALATGSTGGGWYGNNTSGLSLGAY